MDHYYYRTTMLAGLAGGFAPRRTIWHGTAEDALQARRDRTKRIYLVLLMEAGVSYSMESDGGIRMLGDKPDMDLVSRLWNDATLLVQCGRDLQ